MSGPGSSARATARTRRIAALALQVSLLLATVRSVHAQDGLVLSGGGSRGLAHAGVVQGLARKGFRPTVIAGTSMGAIIGALYASGMPPDSIVAVILRENWQDLFAMPATTSGPTFAPRRPMTGLGLGVDRRAYTEGLVPDLRVNRLLVHFFFDAGVRAHNDFDALPRRYRSITADLRDGSPRVLDHGDLARSVRASMAVPGVFAPIVIDGVPLVDGGMANNLPVGPARAAGARRVVGVDVLRPPSDPWVSPLGAGLRALRLLLKNARVESDSADITIVPEIDPNLFAAVFLRDPTPLIDAGRRAALATAPDFATGAPEQPAGARPGAFTSLRARPNDTSVASLVRSAFEGVAPGPYDPTAVFDAIDRLYSTEMFRGIWPTVEWTGDEAELVVNAEVRPPTVLFAAGGYDTDRGFRGWMKLTQRFAGPNEVEAGISGGEIESWGTITLRHIFAAPSLALRVGGAIEGYDVREFAADRRLAGENEMHRAGAWLGFEYRRFQPDIEVLAAMRADRLDVADVHGNAIGPYLRLSARRVSSPVVGRAPTFEAEWRRGDFDYQRLAVAGSIDVGKGGWLGSFVADASAATGDVPPDASAALGDEHLMPGLRWGQDRDRVRVVGGFDMAVAAPSESWARLRLRGGAVADEIGRLDAARWLAGIEAGLMWWSPVGQLSIDAGVNTRGDWRIGLDIGPIF